MQTFVGHPVWNVQTNKCSECSNSTDYDYFTQESELDLNKSEFVSGSESRVYESFHSSNYETNLDKSLLALQSAFYDKSKGKRSC